jgi:hypothetical protein
VFQDFLYKTASIHRSSSPLFCRIKFGPIDSCPAVTSFHNEGLGTDEAVAFISAKRVATGSDEGVSDPVLNDVIEG